MQKAERDRMITQMSLEERQEFRRILEEMHSRTQNASTELVTSRQVLEAHGNSLSPALRTALEAVVARDEMGPEVGEEPPDFALKQLGTDERVQLSNFRGERPVALVFGSYT